MRGLGKGNNSSEILGTTLRLMEITDLELYAAARFSKEKKDIVR